MKQYSMAYLGCPKRASCQAKTLLLCVVALVAVSCCLLVACGAARGVGRRILRRWHGQQASDTGELPGVTRFGADLPAINSWDELVKLFTHMQPKYHVYALPDNMGFQQCHHAVSPDFKHNVDKLFIHKLLREGKSVAPEEADIFIIPELPSQHASRLCRNFHWRQQLRHFLDASPWFRRHNGSDHLLIADHYAWSKTDFLYQLADIPGRVIIGHFESYHSEAKLAHRFFPVGYSTYAALQARGWNISAYPSQHEGDSDISSYRSAVVPFAERRYDVSFVGQVDKRYTYSYRHELGCSWQSGGRDVQERFFVRLRGRLGRCSKGAATDGHPSSLLGKSLPVVEAARVMQQSRYFLHLTGDTPNTDRLFNAFDTLTIPIALASKVDIIIDNAPFPDVVPWRDIIATVDDAAWEDDPVKSVLDAIDSLPHEEVVMKYQLMKRHADDVSFANLDSTRAHTNIINAAWRIAMEQLRELSPVVERAKPHDNVYWPPFMCASGRCGADGR